MATTVASLQLVACLIVCQLVTQSTAFTSSDAFRVSSFRKSVTILFSTPPRQPRRNLKKRRNRQEKKFPTRTRSDDFPWDTAESRPIVSARSKEVGEDYWIDEKELKKSLQLQEAIKNRKLMEGEIPKEKLRTEISAPYKQNWIGFISVGIVVLATIITKFPELLNQPVIPIPDL